MTGTFPPDYFAPDYFGPDYFGGETNANAMSASIAGVATVTASLSVVSTGTERQPLADAGNGKLWDVYQQEILSLLVSKPKVAKRAKKRKDARKRVEPRPDVLLEDLPQTATIAALSSELAGEKARIDALHDEIEGAKALERLRRKRNNDVAILLLAA